MVAVLAAGLLTALAPSPGAAQDRPDDRLRVAVAREAAGDLATAESMLRGLLDDSAAYAPALIALERVLRVQGRLDEMPPVLDAAMAVDPRSPWVNRLRVRTFAALDSVAGVEEATRQWIRFAPLQEVPYRESARVWTERGEPERALAVLEAGRNALGRPEPLALEYGDALAVLGRDSTAALAWGEAIAVDGRGLDDVRDRLAVRPEMAPYVPALVDRLAGGAPAGSGSGGSGGPGGAVMPASRGRLAAAMELALDAGLADRARAVAEGLVDGLAPTHRRPILRRVARRADLLGATALAYWAYGALLDVETRLRYAGREGSGDAVARPGADSVGAERLMALRNRVAELALALGDSAAADAAFRALDSEADPNSPGARAAAALRIELTAARDLDAAVTALGRFATDHPDAPELDRLAVTIATKLLDAGRPAPADSALAGVDGPRAAVLRARRALEEGRPREAREEYVSAVARLTGQDATRALQLVTLLGRVSGGAAAPIGEALRRRDAGDGDGAVAVLEDATAGLPPGDAPPLLDLAARVADNARLEADARRLRERIVADHPDAPETPAALLALGRSLAMADSTKGRARAYLERLIIDYPESALVPQARRVLEGVR